MDKVRIHEIAKEVGHTSKEVLEKANQIGLEVKSASSSVTLDNAERLMNFILTGVLEEASPEKPAPKIAKKTSSQTSKETKKTTSVKKPKKEVSKKPKNEEKLADEPQSETEPKEIQPKAKQKEPKQEELKQEPKEIKKEVKKEIKQEKPKEPEAKQELEKKPIKINKGESLAQASLKKRRGLVIVKKRKEQEPQKPQTQHKKEETKVIPPSLEAIFSYSDETKKKKKKEKKSITTKREEAQKIDLLADRDLADIQIEVDDDMVVLPDFTLKPEIKTEQSLTKKRQNTIQPAMTSRAAANFTEQGIQRRGRKKRKKQLKDKEGFEQVSSVDIPEEIRVYEFAEKLGKQPSEIISKLFMLGLMTTKNDFLDKDSIEILADEFNVEVNVVNAQEEFDYVKAYEAIDDERLEERAPVVTIMGHVDHGKTSLLDYIRSTRVAQGEAGGITQHVGAYMVNKNGKNITFIDTPGHEAFTEMRARGAEVTDIVIIVVAADDGVKPQTEEAIHHAKMANVPIIIAINKMDKEAANPDLVKTQLAEQGIMSVDWGGEHEFVPISAKTGMGIDDLLEIILLQAEILELKADQTRDAKAVVIESSLEKGLGSVATVVMQNGTLKVGDTVVAGVAYGKVRALLDDNGTNLAAIHPGEPGVIVGLSEVPTAGETLIKVENDKAAREYAQKRYEYLRQKELSKSTKVSLDELSAKIAEGEIKSLPIIVKADVQGSLEAIKGSLEKLKNEETKVNIIHDGVGGVSESDVSLASASENCIILGFNIRPTGSVREKAKSIGVEIKTYNVIYDLIDDVKALLGGMMSPIVREEHLGQAEVREVFSIPKIGTIAGCMVREGNINRGAKVRLIRDGIIIYESKISSLKRFKEDAKEVAKGYECGIGIENFNDIKPGDFIESYKEVEEQAVYE